MGETEAFKVEHRGFIVTAFYDNDPKAQDANVVITRDGVPFREFKYSAYRIWNIAAHFTEMVDAELAAAPQEPPCGASQLKGS